MNKEEIIEKISEMECEIKNLKEELNKQEEPKSRWKPELGDRYCFNGDDGSVCYSRWDNCILDNDRYQLGNVFKTEEEAEFVVEQLKVLAELKEYEDDDTEWNNNNCHWSIAYETNRGCIEVRSYCYSKVIPFNLFFSSREQAQRVIDAIGEERLKKYYFCEE